MHEGYDVTLPRAAWAGGNRIYGTAAAWTNARTVPLSAQALSAAPLTLRKHLEHASTRPRDRKRSGATDFTGSG
jgi:hypothetical protein